MPLSKHTIVTFSSLLLSLSLNSCALKDKILSDHKSDPSPPAQKEKRHNQSYDFFKNGSWNYVYLVDTSFDEPILVAGSFTSVNSRLKSGNEIESLSGIGFSHLTFNWPSFYLSSTGKVVPNGCFGFILEEQTGHIYATFKSDHIEVSQAREIELLLRSSVFAGQVCFDIQGQISQVTNSSNPDYGNWNALWLGLRKNGLSLKNQDRSLQLTGLIKITSSTRKITTMQGKVYQVGEIDVPGLGRKPAILYPRDGQIDSYRILHRSGAGAKRDLRGKIIDGSTKIEYRELAQLVFNQPTRLVEGSYQFTTVKSGQSYYVGEIEFAAGLPKQMAIIYGGPDAPTHYRLIYKGSVGEKRSFSNGAVIDTRYNLEYDEVAQQVWNTKSVNPVDVNTQLAFVRQRAAPQINTRASVNPRKVNLRVNKSNRDGSDIYVLSAVPAPGQRSITVDSHIQFLEMIRKKGSQELISFERSGPGRFDFRRSSVAKGRIRIDKSLNPSEIPIQNYADHGGGDVKATSLVAIFHQDSSGKIRLLTEKRGSGVSNAGRIAIPGGHLKQGESFEQGALTEVWEETGLSLSLGDLTMVGRVSSNGYENAFFAILIEGELPAFRGIDHYFNPLGEVDADYGHKWIDVDSNFNPFNELTHKPSAFALEKHILQALKR